MIGDKQSTSFLHLGRLMDVFHLAAGYGFPRIDCFVEDKKTRSMERARTFGWDFQAFKSHEAADIGFPFFRRNHIGVYKSFIDRLEQQPLAQFNQFYVGNGR